MAQGCVNNERLKQKSDLVGSQPKVYQKIELCKASTIADVKILPAGTKEVLKKMPKIFNECDINKNINTLQYVKNGDISKFRRASSSSSGHSSVTSNHQSDESMIVMRKVYKEIKTGTKSMGDQTMIRKTYKKKIFEPDILEMIKMEETSENKEEFYKYLGIDTKPPEKRVYRPDITNLDIFKRRSLRVRYLKIQSQTQCQLQCQDQTQIEGEFEVKSESPGNAIKETSLQVSEKEVTGKGLIERPHDVKILRSYLKPKEKKTVNLLKHQLEKRSMSPVVLLKPIKKIIKVVKEPEPSIKYLMRSKINLSESRLRSGLQKKRLLQPSRYLSYFKNKRVLLRQRPRKEIKPFKSIKESKKTSKPAELSQSITPEKTTKTTASVSKSVPVQVEIRQETATIELPKSPVSQVPDSTVNFQTPTIHHSLALPAQISTSTIDTLTSSAHTLKNPLNRDDGRVLFAYAIDGTLVIVQERSVSFWRYSPFKHLVGMDQTWELIGRTKRHDYGKYRVVMH